MRDRLAAPAQLAATCRRPKRWTLRFSPAVIHVVIPRRSKRLAPPDFLLLVLLSACSRARIDAVVSLWLGSGISSSNGGGMRALGGVPDVGIITGHGPVR